MPCSGCSDLGGVNPNLQKNIGVLSSKNSPKYLFTQKIVLSHEQ